MANTAYKISVWLHADFSAAGSMYFNLYNISRKQNYKAWHATDFGLLSTSNTGHASSDGSGFCVVSGLTETSLFDFVISGPTNLSAVYGGVVVEQLD
jgi:hypothetical protein